MDINAEEITEILTQNPNIEDTEDVLLELKHISDEKRTKKEDFLKIFLLGISFGIIVGAIVGAVTNNFLAFSIAGVIVGIGISFMVHINKK